VGATKGFTVAVWVGNFTGRPMEGVSGITGAGPLLYRAILAAASRRPPGVLLAPEDAGLLPVRICRLSGMRAARGCESLVEWFIPGTAGKGRRLGVRRPPRLPAEYAEWASGKGGRWASAAGAGEDRFRIVAPRGGDHRAPAGPRARPPIIRAGAPTQEAGEVRMVVGAD
jgi:penicillin-binding protein 1C